MFFKLGCNKIILLNIIILFLTINDVSAEISILYENSTLCSGVQNTLNSLPQKKGHVDFSILQPESLKKYSKFRLDAEYTKGAKFDRYVKAIEFDINNDGVVELVLRTDEMVVRDLYRIELYALSYSDDNNKTLKYELTRYLEDTGWISGIGLKLPRIYNLPLSLSDYPLAEKEQNNINHVLPSFIFYSGKNYLVLEEIGRFNRYILFAEVRLQNEKFVSQVKCVYKK
jgi:hypothetical protein